MISLNKLSVDFGGFRLFDEISFLINPKDRIGLVGKNGAGKTTLLRIIVGLQSPTEGSLSMPKDLTLGYLPQNMVYSDSRTVRQEAESTFEEIIKLEKDIDRVTHEISSREDYESESYLDLINSLTEKNERFSILGGQSYHSQIEWTLKGLGFKQTDLDRPTKEFSGGWRMRIELAKILLQKPDVLLLDEPTNHLDIESIQWLEDYLGNYNGAVILISHDRAFLDNITNRTVEISLGRIFDYNVPYTRYVELRAERYEQQMAAYRNQQKKIEDTEAFIDRFRYQASKAIQVQSRIKHLDKIDRIEVDDIDNSALRIKFPPAPHSGIVTVKGKSISKSYDAHLVLDKVDFVIERGEKVAFVGKNGEGKTTLARVILNELDHQGAIELGHQVKIGYFAQNQASELDENLTVFETVDRVAVGDIRTKVRNLLGGFLFGGEAVDKKVSVLSGGERTRLALVLLLLEPVNFLILDEPTNHLDIRSKEILKQALNDFEGTVLLISHDRDFLDGLVNRVYEFTDKNIKVHLGGIYEFLEKKKMDSFKELETANRKSPSGKTTSNPDTSNKASYEERRELNRRIRKISNDISALEKAVEKLEKKHEEMNKVLQDPQQVSDMDSVYGDYEKVQKEMEQKLKEWEKLHEDLDLLEQELENLNG